MNIFEKRKEQLGLAGLAEFRASEVAGILQFVLIDILKQITHVTRVLSRGTSNYDQCWRGCVVLSVTAISDQIRIVQHHPSDQSNSKTGYYLFEQLYKNFPSGHSSLFTKT